MTSLYLLYGDEKYLIENRLASLKEEFKNASLETYDQNTPPESLAEALRMTSLFASERLIILKDIRLSKAEWLLDVLPDLPQGTVLIGLPTQVDRRNKVFKYFSKHGEIFEAKSFAPWQQEDVVELLCKDVPISRPAARRLVEIVGCDLSSLMSEIEKISTYCGEGKTIDEESVKLLAVSGEMDAFALVNSLRFRNVKESQTILQRAFREKADPYGMLGMIAQQFRMLLQVKSCGNASHFDVARRLKSNPFYVKKCQEFATRYKLAEIKHILKRLLETDLLIKTGGDPRILFPMLVNDICHG